MTASRGLTGNLVQDCIGHGANQVRRDFETVEVGQMALDLSGDDVRGRVEGRHARRLAREALDSDQAAVRHRRLC